MAFNIANILVALKAAANIADEVASSGIVGPQAKIIADAAAGIVRNATAVYQQVKPVLDSDDVATVDAALQVAHDKAGTDLDRVLAELATAAAQS